MRDFRGNHDGCAWLTGEKVEPVVVPAETGFSPRFIRSQAKSLEFLLADLGPEGQVVNVEPHGTFC